MTQSHTPGPWRIDYQQDEATYIVAEQGKAWNNPTICHLYQDVTPEDSVTIGPWLEAFDNATANARLIAAAPDMAQTIRDLLALHIAHHNHPHHARAREILRAIDGA